MLTRYTLPEMQQLWGREETKFEYWLMVELAALQARNALGQLPQEAYDAISKHAGFTVNRIKELEGEFNHDMIAFVVCVQEHLEAAGAGQYKEEVHKGLTSYDVEDPALTLMLRRAGELVLATLQQLEITLRQKAMDHQWSYMIARTHGQYAEPTTFGQLLLVYAESIRRSIQRIRTSLAQDLSEGKLSGAVGSYAGMDPQLEEKTLKLLGLQPARAETQILQRDRHAAFLAALAIAASSIEQICRTFWEMMRSEVRELEEPRGRNQRGSSAMAHKKNPILTERLMGMARLMRAASHTAQENIATPEGRDISQSSVERHILPDATSLLHYMASRAQGLVNNLTVFTDNMRHNLEDGAHGVWAGQQIRIKLMEHGVSYETAYLYIQRTSFSAVDQRIHLRSILSQTPLPGDTRNAEDIIGMEELNQCFDLARYLRDGITHIFNTAHKGGE